MLKVRVTLIDGRIVDGDIKIEKNAVTGEPVLRIGDEHYSGLDAITQGFSLNPINDAIVDRWMNTVSVNR